MSQPKQTTTSLMSLEEQIFQHAIRYPYKIALIEGEKRVTYAQLWDRCLCAAETMHSRLSLKKGDRVIVAASGSIDFVCIYFGIHLAGGICVPIDPDTNQTRFDYISKATQPIAVIGMLHKTNIQFIPLEDMTTGRFLSKLVMPNLDDIADIMFTTGTTGAPKGVAISYRNIAAATKNINSYIHNTEKDIELLALPISHSFGLGRMKCVLSNGGALVMLGTFASMKKFFGNMEKHHCTGFGMVPASWSYIKKMSGRKLEQFAGQLKYIELGSSFMAEEDKRLLLEMLPNTRICMHYGSTEASRSAFMEFHAYKDNLLTAGKASPNTEIIIFSTDGKPLPLGEQGEICVKGEHVTCGYWNETPENFASDFYDGYFRTGDCGTMDADGNIYLKSRIKEMINVGGKKVSPMEVEEILNSLPEIKESACIGIPDIVLGEVVKAFIVADENIDNKTIFNALKPKLEAYKIPVAIERLNELPKTNSGKIQRLKLKEL
jgi:long-chain acyl-CoA synthetase